MGLAINIEMWPMPAAIGMATEGIKAKYNDGSGGGGGFGAADYQMASLIDGAKVLLTIDRMQKKAAHLADWSLYAYASPLWNSKENKKRLVESVLNDWVVVSSEQGMIVQKRTCLKVKALISTIAGNIALEQMAGAQTHFDHDGIQYTPSVSRQFLIKALVEVDCKDKDIESDGFRKKRTRYYQNHWSEWEKHIEVIRTLLINYDKSARKLFKKELENKNGAI
ncbi:hypothetical protein HJ101_17315 [Vibrio parahaemolyticus]|nr:hypothetical protein [Vibrio parahaemolyticus]